MNKIKLVVFDIAGTTVKDGGEIALAFQKALQAYGYDVPVAEITALMGYEKSEAIRTMLEKYEVNKKLITAAHIGNIHQQFIREMIVYYKTATAQRGPGPALASHPPADTTRMPGCRRVPPRALRALWSPAMPRQGRCIGSRPAGYARVSLIGSGAARSQWCSG